MDVRQLLAVQIPSYHAQNTPKFRGFTQREKTWRFLLSEKEYNSLVLTLSEKGNSSIYNNLFQKIVYIILSLNSLSLAKFIKK